MLYAIIDIGSSSVRLAIYNISCGHLEMLLKKKHALGLAEFIADNKLQPLGVEKLCAALNGFRDFLADFKISHVTSFTTAAIRNVENQKEILEQIRKSTGLAVRVISGEEEAHYDFAGIAHELDVPSGALIDVGGGSTEIAYYENRELCQKLSLPFGGLLLYTKYVEDIFPSREEIEDMRAEIEQSLVQAKDNGKLAAKSIASLPLCYGIGGTLKSTRLLYNNLYGLPQDNRELDISRFASLISRYCRNESGEEADIISILKNAPDRLKSIIPGLVIFDVICNYCGIKKLRYCDAGMREGFIYEQIMKKE